MDERLMSSSPKSVGSEEEWPNKPPTDIPPLFVRLPYASLTRHHSPLRAPPPVSPSLPFNLRGGSFCSFTLLSLSPF